MSTNDSAELETPATDDSGTEFEIDDRDVRALTQYLTVLPDTGRAAGADELYLVISESGSEYLVDVRQGACTCKDYEYRSEELGPHGCKHQRRVAFATGVRAIPAWIDTDAVDEQLGDHIDGGPRVAATDGGADVIDAGDDGEILDEDGSNEGQERPDDCQCGEWNVESDRVTLPCWPCYREGFEEPNPNVNVDEKAAD